MSYEDDGATVTLNFDRVKETNSKQATLFVMEDAEKQEDRVYQWIPASLIISQGKNYVEVPEWFAQKEGLI